jgi:Raf kinase inhibitor-like YbhB/YbcL family protein|nr:YbhB/YbcL family Raf kinase inhibitor-like protein [Desulforhabdus amnigena]
MPRFCFVPTRHAGTFHLRRFPSPSILCFITVLAFMLMDGIPAPFAAAESKAQKGEYAMSLEITSQAFSQDGSIPRRYTCDGQDASPPLQWSGVPQGTKSLALIVDDPDAPDPKAPKMTWVHWVLYNIPPTATGLPEGVKAKDLPEGTREGLNDWKRTGYGGPCPPIGRHRYFHKLYALDTVLPDLGKPTKAQLEKAMQGHILEQCELVGTYQRSR